MGVCCENHTERTNRLGEQSAELLTLNLAVRTLTADPIGRSV
jgi:hypothetical protein